ncbi:hypothetical protein CDAR_118441 [Caerostris darwini]|uniref:Uncharacterized protein n=1 Tax=Caerostris darwini TaxID=1538125 RepID=A0AAV4X114_9ARAC|nr:hypothetical protein CDAR_118441 [Caerostris darwini]
MLSEGFCISGLKSPGAVNEHYSQKFKNDCFSQLGYWTPFTRSATFVCLLPSPVEWDEHRKCNGFFKDLQPTIWDCEKHISSFWHVCVIFLSAMTAVLLTPHYQ